VASGTLRVHYFVADNPRHDELRLSHDHSLAANGGVTMINIVEKVWLTPKHNANHSEPLVGKPHSHPAKGK
jgi:hypothetical protein